MTTTTLQVVAIIAQIIMVLLSVIILFETMKIRRAAVYTSEHVRTTEPYLADYYKYKFCRCYPEYDRDLKYDFTPL